ncbi:TonB-dependent receptor plug domain-containing protein [Allomuricauda sp. SCSIO 65647]|uniref:TonB-dependent receptor plug domain-containing protein n=1 Tax=Allomuricauda sp. SCSIO 65647 TaxID=2908843 RepID=UPI001F442D6D|nr:TonB-dependent receptor plug domain-containing protein [Muricauda sp. SCSIO 65647]UJH66878.1 TonB-dependent receptor plug domain-containing protein [Muricauda sp. SCSIO 65647]
MCRKKSVFIFFLFVGTWFTHSQNATITGIVLDENNVPLSDVNISSATSGTTTNPNGFYLLQVVADVENTITFSHVGHENIVLEDLILNTNETFEFNPVMKVDVIQIDGVEISPTGRKELEGIETLSPEVVRNIPGANEGVENVLKLLPGVSFNNELSTQYNVRGGSFEENLVYVNEIEVYRPFLIRSAQQEGLSFINSSMAKDIDFSAGGFQAKYGDKLSSVLDITYKIPTSFSLQADASLLGAGITLETLSKDKTLSNITGVRYRSNALFINSQQTQTNVRPIFLDAQTYFSYGISNKLELNFLGTLSLNDYQNRPLTRQTNFGTINEPRALVVFYEGQEDNRFTTALGALKADFKLNEKVNLKLITSVYHTIEEEFSDIIASYELAEVDNDLGSEDLGEPINSRGLGRQINRARNQLDALIFNISHRGKFKKGEKLVQWGLKYTHEDIRDQLREAEFIDSAGFFIRPPRPDFTNNQPEVPFTADIVPFESAQAVNFAQTDRISSFLQYGQHGKWGRHDIYFNLGVRGQFWTLRGEGFESNNQFFVSPRAQFAIKPDWQNDMLFRMAIGNYQQPPFYRELRDRNGNINPEVKAQKSWHFVLGNEYSFKLWGRPFNLHSEVYYKSLTDVNPFTLEDVRLRYAAANNAEAYAYGIDFRLNGTFVPGAESWISVGYLKTEENIEDRGYISRPTDQRLKFALLFQDYVPTVPDLKLYMNLVYQTGVPGGSPNYADPYEFQSRLRDYKRVDLGISYIFADKNKGLSKIGERKLKALSAGFEIFNLFNNQNSITNTWVRDIDSQRQFAVPNFLTARILNLTVSARF